MRSPSREGPSGHVPADHQPFRGFETSWGHTGWNVAFAPGISEYPRTVRQDDETSGLDRKMSAAEEPAVGPRTGCIHFSRGQASCASGREHPLARAAHLWAERLHTGREPGSVSAQATARLPERGAGPALPCVLESRGDIRAGCGAVIGSQHLCQGLDLRWEWRRMLKWKENFQLRSSHQSSNCCCLFWLIWFGVRCSEFKPFLWHYCKCGLKQVTSFSSLTFSIFVSKKIWWTRQCFY